MKIFPVKVERWRKLVETNLLGLFGIHPSLKSSIDRFKPSFPDQVDVILAIIQKESGGDENATGDSGNSIGLMQLNYGAGTPQDMGYTGTKEELKNPEINVYYGAKYFLKQVARYDDLNKAILAYNAGSYITKSGLPVNLEYLNAVLSYLTEKKTSLLSGLPPPDSISISDTEKEVESTFRTESDKDHTTIDGLYLNEDHIDIYGNPIYEVHRKVFDYLIGSFIVVVLMIYFFTCN